MDKFHHKGTQTTEAEFRTLSLCLSVPSVPLW